MAVVGNGRVAKRAKQSGPAKLDQAKEQSLKALGAILSQAGYIVRREKLKRGPGWRAMSGSCQRPGEGGRKEVVIFVDRSMPQDEQIEFLVGRIRELALAVNPEDVRELPDSLRQLLGVLPPVDPEANVAA